VGSLAFEVSTGGEFMTVWSMEGNQGDEWMTAELELSDYIGQSVQLRITGTTGTTYSSDIAIDAVSVFEGILGCTDETACNYNEDATLSDNSCDYFSCATCEQVDTESYQQGFEDGTVDWTQETEDDIDWTLNVGSTPSFGTGPQMASETSTCSSNLLIQTTVAMKRSFNRLVSNLLKEASTKFLSTTTCTEAAWELSSYRSLTIR
jgi:hypothetical protein